MYRIEYDIKLNESGRPYIYLPEDYEQKPEDRFFSIEVVRYIINDLLRRRKPDLDQNTADMMEITESFLGQIGDEIAKILWHQMKTMGDIAVMLDVKYHFQVQSFDDLDKSSISNYIFQNNKIYEKKEGLKVFVIDQGFIYELQKDIENQLFWTIIS